MNQNRIYIGLGSNLDEPHKQIEKALKALDQQLAEDDLHAAKLVCTPPMGGPEQDNYLNTVATFTCSKSPEEILSVLRSIENEQGRTRDVHWGPRTIDLDLLLCGHALVESDHLSIPHPGIHEREFVLVPLLELAPDLKDPRDGRAYQESLDKFRRIQSSTLINYESH